ncbi:hypothetical protein IW261DRAFT_1419619 [Armillaria novae-zelandiae]|uniref:Uncharacterized protein n=1 Tax=Armillaria novae-zelandiae TaxID=153914 RepID=A0AA39P8P9_9AGAR|nr:hypothetical protein IW261DRAFT_1419619 [Armillaria novae-zelandiae]
MAACPSVAELLNGVRSLTRQNQGTFQTAWSDSFVSPSHCCEQGGFIYVDFPVPNRVTRAFITRAPKGATMNQTTSGPNASIDLNRPGIRMNKVILGKDVSAIRIGAANFHTHPLSKQVGGDPQPSRPDMANAYARGLLGIVISRDGIYSYGPERRANTNNPKGYPGPVSPPAVARPTLAKRQPPPWVVRNQRPEGTPRAADDMLVENEATSDDSPAGDLDVIYVEWSDEDVVYEESLVESEDSIEIRGETDE